jgi:hypothetical protein
MDEDEIEEINRLDKLLIKSHIEEIIIAFKDNIDFIINYVQNVNNFFGTKTDVNHIIIESLFNLILRTGNNSTENAENNNKIKLIYFSLLTIFSKNSDKFNSIINNTIDNIIQKIINKLDIESIESFVSFLAFYISNKQFIFDEYKKLDALISNNNKHHKNYVFVKMLINKLCTLGTKQKITELVQKYSNLTNILPDEDIAKWK